MRFAAIPFFSALIALTVAAPVAHADPRSIIITKRGSVPTGSMPPKPTGGFPSGFPVKPSGAVPSGVFPSGFPTMPSGAILSGIFPSGFETQAFAPTGTPPALPSGSGFPHPYHGHHSGRPFKSIAARQEPSGAPPSGAPPMPTGSFSGMPSGMPPMPTGGFPSGFPAMPSGAIPSGVFPPGVFGAEATSSSGSEVPHYDSYGHGHGHPSGTAPSSPAPSGPVPTV